MKRGLIQGALTEARREPPPALPSDFASRVMRRIGERDQGIRWVTLVTFGLLAAALAGVAIPAATHRGSEAKPPALRSFGQDVRPWF